MFEDLVPGGGGICRGLGKEALLCEVCQWEQALRLYSFSLIAVCTVWFLHSVKHVSFQIPILSVCGRASAPLPTHERFLFL